MISQQLFEVLKPHDLLARILWSVFAVSIGIYLGVAYFLGFKGTPTIPTDESSLVIIQTVFSAVSLMTAGLSFGFKKFLLRDAVIQKRLSREISLDALARNPKTGQVDAEQKLKIETLSQHEQSLLSLRPLYFTAMLISLALSESIAIFGLVLALMTGSIMQMIPFAAISLLLLAMHFPRLGAFLERASETHCRCGAVIS